MMEIKERLLKKSFYRLVISMSLVSMVVEMEIPSLSEMKVGRTMERIFKELLLVQHQNHTQRIIKST